MLAPAILTTVEPDNVMVPERTLLPAALASNMFTTLGVPLIVKLLAIFNDVPVRSVDVPELSVTLLVPRALLLAMLREPAEIFVLPA